MDTAELATREIYWNIPPSYKAWMYALFAAALCAFAAGLARQASFVAAGGGPGRLRELLRPGLQWRAFFSTVLFTGKALRDGRTAVFHSLIFYGFVVLWIATDLVAIHADTPFKIYRGWTYIVVSFFADAAGIAMLAGIALAWRRRYVERPAHLSAARPRQEMFMYGMLVALVVLGYALESIRIFGTGMPEGEARWSPVGWALALGVGALPVSDEGLGLSYRVLWLVHMANTMLFVAVVPWTKFSHIVLLPLAALVSPRGGGAVLAPMDFGDGERETFGLGRLSELTPKNRLDLLSCVECGRCSLACPALRAGKDLDPKTVVTKLRDLAFGARRSGGARADADIWEAGIYKDNELDACTTCGACMEECPAGIGHVPLIMEAKRYKALTLGRLPPKAADAVRKIQVNGNPWGVAAEERLKWADGLDVPVAEPGGRRVDYLYYVGCAGAFDPANQKVARDVVALLRKAGVDFAVMGKTEKCNGDPVRRFGDEYAFAELAVENIAHMNRYSFGKVVTHCPHCLHTIGKEYAGFEGGGFEVVHHTRLLADLVSSGRLEPARPQEGAVTFHDPCYLGRHHGEYAAPREVLGSVPGLELREMEESKDRSLCCGMGGGNMWYELPEGEELAAGRLEGAAGTGAPRVATACSYCMINFRSSKSRARGAEDLGIDDVASILARSVL